MRHPIEARWPFADPDKLQLFSFPTPNGVKVGAALEELGLPYEAHVVHIGKGDQHTEEFRALSPNGKIPVIFDPHGPGGEPMGVMESGAILLYLADKAGALVPTDPRGRLECLQWMLFQVGHVGPMFGQFGHFLRLDPEVCDHPYPRERYTAECKRLLTVLEGRLAGRAYLMGDDYSIADLMIWPWLNGAVTFYKADETLEMRAQTATWDWLQRCLARPASQRGLEVASPPKSSSAE